MRIKAKRNVAYDFKNYGIDFKQGNIYAARPDDNGYYAETENGSEVWITDEDVQGDFDVEEE